jgi:hypothetical protein
VVERNVLKCTISNILKLEVAALLNVNVGAIPEALTLIGVGVDTGVPPFTDRLAESPDPVTANVVKKEPDVKGLNDAITSVFMLLLVCEAFPAIIIGVFALRILIG